MKYTYYMGKGPEADVLIAECQAALTAHNAAMDTFTAWAKANGWKNCAVRGNAVCGVISERKLTPAEMSERGVKYLGPAEWDFVYAPIKNRNASAAMRKAIDAARMEDFSASDHIIKETGMRHSAVGVSGGRRVLVHSVAGYGNGVVLVKVPLADSEYKSSIPTPPEWLSEVKESVFLAAQGR